MSRTLGPVRLLAQSFQLLHSGCCVSPRGRTHASVTYLLRKVFSERTQLTGPATVAAGPRHQANG